MSNKVYHRHGLNEPFTVVREARPDDGSDGMPRISRNKVRETGSAWIVKSDDEYPRYAAVFWLITPVGRGRSSVSIDYQGNVQPNLFRETFGAGTPGVGTDDMNPGDLEFSGFMHEKLARGLVRVDHLKDENGVPLGVPADNVWTDGEKKRDYAWGLFNPARLAQLGRELKASEQGRKLALTWTPKIPANMHRRIRSAIGKSRGQVEADTKTLETINTYLGKLRARYMAGVNGAATPVATEAAVAGATEASTPEPETPKPAPKKRRTPRSRRDANNS